MPYIKMTQRAKYTKALIVLRDIWEKEGWLPGDLNYIVSQLMHQRMRQKRKYNTANELMGVLSCAMQEFYRIEVAPYEDEKIKENGSL